MRLPPPDQRPEREALYSAGEAGDKGAVAPGSKVCSHCGRLTAADEARCAHCGRRLPAAWQHAVGRWGALLGQRSGATTLFLILSVAVYSALLLSAQAEPRVSGWAALRWGALVGEIGRREPWRYLSAIFVHFSLLHVGFNSLALVSFGRHLEQMLGSARFSVLFLMAGAGGFVASDFWYTPQPLTGGMSGAIFGLLGVEVGLRHAGGDEGWKRAAISGVGYAVAMALLPGQNVNNAAHLGGLLCGAAGGWLLFRIGSNRRADRAFAAAAWLLLLATFAAILHSWVALSGQGRIGWAVPARLGLVA